MLKNTFLFIIGLIYIPVLGNCFTSDDPNANAIILKESSHYIIESINKMSLEYKSVIKVMNKDGDRYAHPYINYDDSDRIIDIGATLYDASGNVIKKYRKPDFNDQAGASRGTFISDNRILALDYTPFDYPYTIEFHYKLATKNTVFIPNFYPFTAYNIGLKESEFSLTNKTNIKLRTKIYPSKYGIGKVESAKNGDTSTFYFKNIPAVANESNAPSIIELVPKVSSSLDEFNLEGKKGNISSWEEFGKWYYNEILEPVSGSKYEIKSIVKTNNLSGLSTKEKVKKIYEKMQSKTRYIAVMLGIGGWQPMSPKQVESKGYGDCKGLTNYMRALLESEGIPSYYAIINSNPTATSFDKDFPKMGGNHVILMVPTEDGNIWLENTSQSIGYNHLSYSTTNRNALLVKPDGITIIDTPVYTADENFEKENVNIKINEDQSAKGSAILEFGGSQYDMFLGLIDLNKEEQKEQLKNLWTNVDFNSIDVTSITNDKSTSTLSCNFNFGINNFAKNLGNSIIFRAVPFNYSSSISSANNRKLPFELNNSTLDSYTINYSIPEGYEIEEMPSSFNITSEFGLYSIKIERKDNKIVVLRSLHLEKGIYPKEKYKDYVAFRKKVAAKDYMKFLITKK